LHYIALLSAQAVIAHGHRRREWIAVWEKDGPCSGDSRGVARLVMSAGVVLVRKYDGIGPAPPRRCTYVQVVMALRTAI